MPEPKVRTMGITRWSIGWNLLLERYVGTRLEREAH